MIRPGFLPPEALEELTKLAKSVSAPHGEARRANALILLNKGWSCQEVARALLIDDDTVRAWYKLYDQGDVGGLVGSSRGMGKGTSFLTDAQKDELKQLVKETTPKSIREVGAQILKRFGVEYKSSSGLQYLLKSLGICFRKPTVLPRGLDEAKQVSFINKYNNIANNLSPDEIMLFGDAVHPTHSVRVRGVWTDQHESIAIEQNSGRNRLNLHGAVDLESGKTYLMDVETVDAMSTIALFSKIEQQNPDKFKIHLFVDNAKYHHARLVQEWLAQPGRRIVLHFIPAYCPHLNPIERLWKLMHQNVTYNKSYETFQEFGETITNFLKIDVPKKWNEFCESVTDNFRVIVKGDFRILA